MNVFSKSPNWNLGSSQWLTSALVAIAVSLMMMLVVPKVTDQLTLVGCSIFNTADWLNQGGQCSVKKGKEVDEIARDFSQPDNHQFREYHLFLNATMQALHVILAVLVWILLGAARRYRPGSRWVRNGWLLLPLAYVFVNIPRLFSIELTAVTVWLMALYALLIGIEEELWFRAILARFFRNHSAGFFIVVSSLAFALAHERDLMLFAGVGGACLAIAYVSGASLGYVIVVHALVDFGMKLPQPSHSVMTFAYDIGFPVVFGKGLDIMMLVFVLVYLMHPAVWCRPSHRSNEVIHPQLSSRLKLPASKSQVSRAYLR